MKVALGTAAPAEGASEFDLNLPPADTPTGCMDAVMWRRAHGLFSEHPAGPECCERCGVAYPCRGSRLARAGLLTAVGQVNEDSVYWRGYARLLGSQPAAESGPQSSGGRV